MTKETISKSIVNGDSTNPIRVSVVQSTADPTKNGIVLLNPDWSSIGWSSGGGLPYTAVSSSITITQWNVYGVDATSGDINLTLSDGTVAWQVLTVKKLDNTDNIVYINNASIDWATSAELTIENESIDIYWTGTAFIIN